MSRPATPPVWKVRSVSCVPGSPTLCAATTPTASPSSDQRAGGQVAPVAAPADADLGRACQDGAYGHPVDAGRGDAPGRRVVDLAAARREDRPGRRLRDRRRRDPPRQARRIRRHGVGGRRGRVRARAGRSQIPSAVPQSSSVTTTAWAAATSRRVR